MLTFSRKRGAQAMTPLPHLVFSTGSQATSSDGPSPPSSSELSIRSQWLKAWSEPGQFSGTFYSTESEPIALLASGVGPDFQKRMMGCMLVCLFPRDGLDEALTSL